VPNLEFFVLFMEILRVDFVEEKFTCGFGNLYDDLKLFPGLFCSAVCSRS